MLKYLQLLVGICAYSSTFLSCAPGPLFVSTEDVSEEKKFWGGYTQMETYLLKNDVFLRKVDLDLPKKEILIAPREKTKDIYTLHFSSPHSIADYKKNKEDWVDIDGIVISGTRLQISSFIKYNPFGYSDALYIYADILDGPFSGKEVEISQLSLPDGKIGGMYLLKPNQDLLTKMAGEKGIGGQ